MLRLIVNADDFGLTAGVNRAILQCHTQGIVTSATLMANASAFTDAVAMAHQSPDLGVGCHLVLVDGTPLAPTASIPSLLEPASPTSGFRRKLWKFALAAVRGKISSHEVEIEASAQIARLLQAGIQVSHVDCHKHTHMFPAVLEGVLRAAANHGIRAIRNPFEPSFARPAAVSRRNAIRSAETAILRQAYVQPFRNLVTQYGFVTTDGSLGVTVTGTLNPDSFDQTIRALPPDGTYELVCHPGYNDADLAAAGTRLLQSREIERAVLSSPQTRQLLDSAHITLTNFFDLLHPPESNPAPSNPMRDTRHGPS